MGRGEQLRTIIGVVGAGVVSAFTLGGCVLPASMSAISSIFDGASYVATGKSLQDQAISAMADKDCALWRAVAGREMCVEKSESSVAFLPVQPPARSRDGDSEAGDLPAAAALPESPSTLGGDESQSARAESDAMAEGETEPAVPAVLVARASSAH